MKMNEFSKFFVEDNPILVDFTRFVEKQELEFNKFIFDNHKSSYKFKDFECCVMPCEYEIYSCNFIFREDILIGIAVELNGRVVKYFGEASDSIVEEFGEVDIYDYNDVKNVSNMIDFYFIFCYDKAIKFEHYHRCIWAVNEGLSKYIKSNVPTFSGNVNEETHFIRYENGKSLIFEIEKNHITKIIFLDENCKIEKQILE